MHVMAAEPDGGRIVRSQSVGDVSEAEEIGRRAAKTLLESGASEFVQGG